MAETEGEKAPEAARTSLSTPEAAPTSLTAPEAAPTSLTAQEAAPLLHNEVFQLRNFSNQVLGVLNCWRTTSVYCDVTVTVGDTDFKLHRCVLAAGSPKFHQILSTTTHNATACLTFDGMPVEGFKHVLDYLYMGNICLNKLHCKDILKTAKFLQVEEVVSLCRLFLRSDNTLSDHEVVIVEVPNSRKDDGTDDGTSEDVEMVFKLKETFECPFPEIPIEPEPEPQPEEPIRDGDEPMDLGNINGAEADSQKNQDTEKEPDLPIPGLETPQRPVDTHNLLSPPSFGNTHDTSPGDQQPVLDLTTGTSYRQPSPAPYHDPNFELNTPRPPDTPYHDRDTAEERHFNKEARMSDDDESDNEGLHDGGHDDEGNDRNQENEGTKEGSIQNNGENNSNHHMDSEKENADESLEADQSLNAGIKEEKTDDEVDITYKVEHKDPLGLFDMDGGGLNPSILELLARHAFPSKRKGGRGRPRKQLMPIKALIKQQTAAARRAAASGPGRRKRGRPRKIRPEDMEGLSALEGVEGMALDEIGIVNRNPEPELPETVDPDLYISSGDEDHRPKKRKYRRRMKKKPLNPPLPPLPPLLPGQVRRGRPRKGEMRPKAKICEKCKRIFEHGRDLTRHIKLHEKGTLLYCPVCNWGFQRKGELTKHMRGHTGTTYHCSHCNQDWINPRDFKMHMLKEHEEKKPFLCKHPGCNFTCDRPSNLEKHTILHSGLKTVLCPRCGKAFPHVDNLYSHRKSCLQQRGYMCDICGSKFNHLSSLKGHRRLHTGEKPYVCIDCGASFADSRNYKRHRRSHERFPDAPRFAKNRLANGMPGSPGHLSQNIQNRLPQVSLPPDTYQPPQPMQAHSHPHQPPHPAIHAHAAHIHAHAHAHTQGPLPPNLPSPQPVTSMSPPPIQNMSQHSSHGGPPPTSHTGHTSHASHTGHTSHPHSHPVSTSSGLTPQIPEPQYTRFNMPPMTTHGTPGPIPMPGMPYNPHNPPTGAHPPPLSMFPNYNPSEHPFYPGMQAF